MTPDDITPELPDDPPLPDELPPEPKAEDEDATKAADDAGEAAAPEPDGDDAAAEDAEDADEGEDTPKSKRSKGFQERIDRLTRQRRDAERDADYWRRRAMEQGRDAPREPAPAKAAATTPPREEDFETERDYIVALAKHEAREELQAERRQQEARATEVRAAETARAFQDRANAAREKHDDFDEVAFSDQAHVTDTMLQGILDSEHGPDIAYHLGKNLDEAQRIARLTPVGQLRELGKIEAKLTAPQPPKKRTAAPPPAKTLAGGGTADFNPETATMDEYIAHRRKQSDR